MTRAQPYIVLAGGRLADAGGLDLKAGSEQTDGLLTVVEGSMPAHASGPPLHVHSREDESFYVLEGELTVQVGEETFHAGPGSFVWMPREIPHAFANAGASPVRMLGISVPGGLENILAATPRDGSAVDRTKIAEVLADFGSRVVGPPLQVPGPGAPQ